MSQKRIKRTHLRAALVDLDLDQFFADAISERCLFPVLNSLANACADRAGHFHQRMQQKEDLHPAVRVGYEDEAAFFEEAEVQILGVRQLLEAEFEGRLPTNANGDLHAWIHNERAQRAGAEYTRNLIETLSDPDTPDEQKRIAGKRLREEGHSTWIDRHTGQPSFEIAKLFASMTEDLANPAASLEEKKETASQLQKLLAVLPSAEK